jgi:DNA-binding MarR family transcriptional regulator
MPNVSRLLNKLMEKGLIEKQRDTSDQRVVYIKITQNGINAKKAAREMINGVVIDLTSEQSDLLNNLLEKVRA